MTDPTAVYLVRSGDNPELRYSLRSLVNLPHSDVLLVGGGPRWYNGPRLRVDQSGHKSRVTTRAMRAVVESRLTTDPFTYLNDDFYVLQPGPLPPAYHRGPIDEVLASYAGVGLTPDRSRWLDGMARTRDLLRRRGIREPLCYELHIPLVVDKRLMTAALNLGGYKRTVYGNLLDEPGEQIADDVKIHHQPHYDPATLPGIGRWLSTVDESLPRVEELLGRLFPTPSVYER
jgi:hypothetical protein